MRLPRGLARTRCAVVMIAVCFCIYAAPPILIYFKHVSPLVYASESIGYRYFYSYRILNGDYENTFLPQGHTLGLFQHAIVGAMDAFCPTTRALRLQLDTFAYATMLGAVILTGVALVWAIIRARLDCPSLLLIGVVLVASVYACRSGISNLIGADYYSYEVSFSILALALALPYSKNRALPCTWGTTIFFGLILGSMLGVKPTLFAVGVLCYIAADYDGVGISILRLSIIVLIAGATWLGILILYYFPHPFYVTTWFKWFLAFSRHPGVEPAFWKSLLSPGSQGANPGADYSYAGVTGLLWIAAMLGGLLASIRPKAICLRSLVVTGVAIVLGGIQMFVLVMRPAGTTLWEIHLYCLCSATVVLSVIPKDFARTILIFFWSAVLFGFCALEAPSRLAELLSWRRLANSTASVWKAHECLSEIRGPVELIFPNNDYTCGSVEEAILKGFSDLPSWNITVGAALLKVVAPQYHYRQNAPLPGANAYFWIDSDEVKLPPQIAASLQKLMIEQPGTMMTWETNTFPWWRRRIHIFSVTSSLPIK